MVSIVQILQMCTTLPIFVCLQYKFTLQVQCKHGDIVKMLWHMCQFLLGQTKIK